MISRHAPGPWAAVADDGGNEFICTTVNIDKREFFDGRLAELWDTDGRAPSERAANGRVMAAAPELLAACEAALLLLDGVPSDTNRQVRAAIRKARGQ